MIVSSQLKEGFVKKAMSLLLVVPMVLGAVSALASTPVTMISSKFQPRALDARNLVADLKARMDVEPYREVKGQVIYNSNGQPDHMLVYLLKKGSHSVQFARVEMDADYHLISDVRDYANLQPEDSQQQNGDLHAAVCPDPSVQFIAFAPNDNDIEQQVTLEVVAAAQAAGLKTVSLLKADATRQAYLNYLMCPNLVGNFYDGDANPNEMTTVDGVLNATDFSTTLKSAFRYKLTNIWLACEAYNDPMLSAVTVDAQAQKYAAGVNDLQIGPSDKAGACAMEAAIKGQPMTAAFQDCYKQQDVSSDQWGFGGKGADLFNH